MSRKMLIGIQLVAALLWPVWVFTAMFAPMLFDGGATTQAYVLLAICLAVPILVVLLSIAMWVAHKKRMPRLVSCCAYGLLLLQLPLSLFVA